MGTHRGPSGLWRRSTFLWRWWRRRSRCPGCARKRFGSTASQTAGRRRRRPTARPSCATAPWGEEHLTDGERSVKNVTTTEQVKHGEMNPDAAGNLEEEERVASCLKRVFLSRCCQSSSDCCITWSSSEFYYKCHSIKLFGRRLTDAVFVMTRTSWRHSYGVRM